MPLASCVPLGDTDAPLQMLLTMPLETIVFLHPLSPYLTDSMPAKPPPPPAPRVHLQLVVALHPDHPDLHRYTRWRSLRYKAVFRAEASCRVAFHPGNRSPDPKLFEVSFVCVWQHE